MLDQNGKVFIAKKDAQNREYRISPLEDGWFKSFEWSKLVGKIKIQEAIKGRISQFKTVEKYVLQVFKVTAPTCKNCLANPNTDTLTTSHDFIKKASIKSGILYRCFAGRYGAFLNSDMTTYISEDANPKAFELLSETTLENEEEILKLYLDGKLDFCGDMSVIQFIEKRINRTL
jgi:hypothetical protein